MKVQALFFFLLIALSSVVRAQIIDNVNWNYTLSEQGVEVGQEVDITFNGLIARDWYVYSSDFDPDLGPMLTTFNFIPNSSYELVGEIKPVNPSRKYDSLIWKGEYSYFSKKAVFKQTVKVLSQDFKLSATVKGQVCSDVTGQCVLFEHDFNVSGLKVTAKAVKEEPAKNTEENTAPPLSPTDNTEKAQMAQNDAEIAETEPTAKETAQESEVITENEVAASTSKERAVPNTVEGADTGFMGFLAISFLWGIAAIFTPCVFPMIPMTVTFFTGKGKMLHAFLFGLSIVAIYTLVGAVVAPLFGPAFANFISTHWLPNVLFFLIFLLFALAFFGMFELVLPSSLVNSMDKQADRGGFAGVFFMAFTLVLVSFSCTGPIVGSILVASAGGEIVKPIAGMFMFGLSFGLPFTLFALFPSWLQKLPQSGGWLNSVKVVLGFIELGLAFKFLSVADQVYHWGILDRHVYIAIWIAISLALGLYLLGFITLPHDSKVDKISVPRMLMGILSIAFVIYLLPGMFGAPLKGLSGYLPPRTTHDFDLVAMMRQGNASGTMVANREGEANDSPKYADFLTIPHGIKGYFDYEEGMAAAKKAGKPVFIDFTGHGCVNCRKMEDNVWGAPSVISKLKNEYVVIALYVDDRTEIPESEWVTANYDGKLKKTIGSKNAAFQIDEFENNAQPFYVLLDHEGELLVRPVAYEPDVNKFANFLESGLEAFEEQKEEIALRSRIP